MLHVSPKSGFPARAFSGLGVSYDSLGLVVGLCDAVVIWISSIIGGSSYQYFLSDHVGDVATHFGVGLIASIAYVLTARNLGIYSLPSLLQTRRDYGQILASWVIVVLLLSLILFLFKIGAQLSRGSVVCIAALTLVALIAWRKFIKRTIRVALNSGALSGRRTILVGTRGELAPLRADKLLELYGLNEVARATLPDHDALNPVISLTERAAVEAALDLSRTARVEEIIIALPWGSESQLDFVREMIRSSPLPVRLMPDHYIRSVWAGHGTSKAGNLLIDLQRAPLTKTELTAKRIFDVAIASAMLLVLFPLLTVTAMAIRFESPGPILFGQRRRGFNGGEFVIHKFRTMRVMEDGENIRQASKNDPRVTSVGKWLRRSSIDELPQLFNVIKGEMSLVGPRPHAVAHDKQYGALLGNYAFRHHVKPGITGWAQVNGYRGETTHIEQMQKRVEFDVWYINNWSLAIDFQILARTCIEVGRTQKAY